jgi:preprotein translocase subunit SecF
MEILKRQTNIDFVSKRYWSIGLSTAANVATLVLLMVMGLNFGLDFTGGTLVEVNYREPVEVAEVRQNLARGGIADAVVQRFGSTRDLMVRMPLDGDANKDAATASAKLVDVLRAPFKERALESRAGQAQQCRVDGEPQPQACHVQIKRIEFVGPQIGRELAEKGALALIFTTIGIMIYVIFRFEWRFAVGAIIATAHDVFLVFGFFTVTQMEFSLQVLAAIMAVLGYSLNDTVVVFDRIRENFRKLRKQTVPEIMNASINQTLARTIITSGSTALTMVALFLFGGETLRGFAVAMLIGIGVGTYSSIFIATPVTLMLGITRDDMLPPKKEVVQDSLP